MPAIAASAAVSARKTSRTIQAESKRQLVQQMQKVTFWSMLVGIGKKIGKSSMKLKWNDIWNDTWIREFATIYHRSLCDPPPQVHHRVNVLLTVNQTKFCHGC